MKRLKQMKRVRHSLTIGILLVFAVTFIVLMINVSANYRIVNESQSLLKDNYPSVKYAFEMLTKTDQINAELIYYQRLNTDSSITKGNTFDVETALEKVDSNLKLQEQHITEPGEKELTLALRNTYETYRKSIQNSEFTRNFEAYWTKYQNLRETILSIHNLNIALLESKNEEINNSIVQISNMQEKVGIAGLTILVVLILVLPMLIINPIDKLAERMIKFYKTNFNKEIVIETNHELEKLETIFEKIVLEAKTGGKFSEEEEV